MAILGSRNLAVQTNQPAGFMSRTGRCETALSDDFDRASLGGNWRTTVTAGGDSTMGLVANQIKMAYAGGAAVNQNGGLIANFKMCKDDHHADFVFSENVTYAAGEQHGLQIKIRQEGSAFYYAHLIRNGDPITNTMYIRKTGHVAIGTWGGDGDVGPQVMGAVGTTITFVSDGTSHAVTDSAVPTGKGVSALLQISKGISGDVFFDDGLFEDV